MQRQKAPPDLMLLLCEGTTTARSLGPSPMHVTRKGRPPGSLQERAVLWSPRVISGSNIAASAPLCRALAGMNCWRLALHASRTTTGASGLTPYMPRAFKAL